MQIQICKRFCFNFAYCDHGNERYTMGVNFLQISCMLICKNEANLVNVIFTMTLLITLRVRKSVFSSRVFSIHFFRNFFPDILIFFQTFKNCRGLPKFFTDLPKIFPRPTKNFSQTYQKCNFFSNIKFLQFCLSNSDVSTTFGHFSQKSPLCRCGSYTHGSQRLMVSTEIIKNWGGKMGGGQKIILGGICLPLLLPWRRH